MSAKAIRENIGKELLNKHLKCEAAAPSMCASFNDKTEWSQLTAKHAWLSNTKLVVKPDQLIKRRGKLGLIKVNCDLGECKQWIAERINKETKVGKACGRLTNFIIEPFCAHKPEDEVYVCVYSHRNGDIILFHHEGGVEIGDVDAKASKLEVPIGQKPSRKDLERLVSKASKDRQGILIDFIEALYKVYVDLFFTYLEINPLVVTSGKCYVLDLAAKLDQCAEYLCKQAWGEIDFPPPFGRDATKEEAYIADLDAKSGASLKLTILNAKGRIWTMVAGGGASVIYADTVCELGGASELANYGEYSGAPSEQQTYEYAKTLLSIMTKEIDDRGKVLIIGGGIANFTNVAATFKGIVKALREFQTRLIKGNISIFVRRGGPNYQEGLRVMTELGDTLGVPIHVFGPETHMTGIVAMALGKREMPRSKPKRQNTTANFVLPGETSTKTSTTHDANKAAPEAIPELTLSEKQQMFSTETKCVIWGLQSRAVQGMLDFDYSCRRRSPSVVAMIYPFTGDHKQKFYWGHKEILIPVYKQMSDCFAKHSDADVLVSFASLRSAYDSTIEAMGYSQIRTIAIIAEGIPENLTRKINQEALKKNITIIGPATVGGIKPGCFKIGNTGGMLDNILSSKLYRPGSIAYVSRSGGMSNELNNIIAMNADGVYEGVAIGGDRYPGTTFVDHLLRFNECPDVKMLVLLGEVGGVEEYKIVEALNKKQIKKPIVAWCIGTCANMFTSEVQFGHAGSCAQAERETAVSKNKALAEAGAVVPRTFDELGDSIKSTFDELVAKGDIIIKPEVAPPTVPMDYNWARELGLIRKPASFMTSICDERGQELLYAGVPITEIFEKDLGLGGVLGLLWFQRRLPPYACKFIEMVLMVTADHGPAVSGAHNTIVCARAGKDLISSLTSGLLTIGDRFGGALDEAAKTFAEAYDTGKIPMEFVNEMRAKGKLIMGIGHRVKSINNPDKRVVILKEYVKKHFPATPVLDYACEVEKITTSKKPNLILNVDGFIGSAMVDLLRHCGGFTAEEAQQYVDIGALNGLFVLGRSIGFIGHFLDQKRLKQGLYRHPWDDISYVLPEQNE